MHFSGPALAAILIPLALAGCSSDVDENDKDTAPTENSPSATSDPITFLPPADQAESSAELACTDPGDEVLVMAGLKTSAPVTVTSVVPFGGTGFTVKEASVAAMDGGRRPTAAMLHRPDVDDDSFITSKGYDDRTELAETELEPGTLYQLFLTTEVNPDDTVGGYELGWTTDGERGTSELSSQVTAGSPC